MRKFQRAAVVAAVVAGLSALGGGVSFANGGGYDGGGYDGGVTAIASSQANAVAGWGGPQHGQSHGEGPQAPWFAPENGVSFTPAQGHEGPHGH